MTNNINYNINIEDFWNFRSPYRPEDVPKTFPDDDNDDDRPKYDDGEDD